MLTRGWKKLLEPLRRTPFHPQWFTNRERCDVRGDLRALQGLVLDIGCADRFVMEELSTQCQYVGLDYYATVKSLYSTRPDIFGDAQCLPIRSAEIDAVVMLEVLEHVGNPESAIFEVARVLRPGGIFVASVPFIYPIHDAPHDYHRFTLHALEALLRRNSLTPLQISTRLRSFETAALLFCLAAGDAALLVVRRSAWGLVLLPFFALAILIANVAGWTLSRLFPGTDFMAGGYRLVAKRNNGS